MRIAIELVVFAVFVVVPLGVHAGVLDVFLRPAQASQGSQDEVIKTDSALDVPVLVAAQNTQPNSSRGGDDVLALDGVLISTGPVGKDDITAARGNGGEISVYTVRSGDSLSQIAEMFDVTANTILWANDLPKASAISPGDTLVILPIAGVRHVVKSGDTVASIAKKYDADVAEIIAFNQIDEAARLVSGETLVIPGGAMQAAPIKVVAQAKPTKTTSGLGSKTVAMSGSFVNPAPGALKTQGLHGYNAVDLAAGVGTAIRAAAAGEVIVAKSSGWNGGYGSYIVVKHANGVQTLYAHLSRVDVTVGSTVSSAQVMGAIGMTGKTTGPHLHFEIRGGKNPF